MTQEPGGQSVRGESGSQRWGGLKRDQGSGHMGLAPGKQGGEMHQGPERRGSGPLTGRAHTGAATQPITRRNGTEASLQLQRIKFHGGPRPLQLPL